MPKSTRAIKITDTNKAWNKKTRPSKYQLDSIPINKTILIVCEGQTEKLYFESFPVIGVDVKAIDLGGQSKLKLIEVTSEIVESIQDPDLEIWCVFDMDKQKGETEFADFDNAITKAIRLGYFVAYSNDSFELWYCLHYHLHDSQQLRTFYYKELSQRFGINYEKDGKRYGFCSKIYEFLISDKMSSQPKAIERAKHLFNIHKNRPYHQQNPVTTVFRLVEELNRNLRR